MLLLVTISLDSAAKTSSSSLRTIEGRRMLDVVSKWKLLLIPLQLLKASSGDNEKHVPHALTQFRAYCTFFCQLVLLMQRYWRRWNLVGLEAEII